MCMRMKYIEIANRKCERKGSIEYHAHTLRFTIEIPSYLYDGRHSHTAHCVRICCFVYNKAIDIKHELR